MLRRLLSRNDISVINEFERGTGSHFLGLIPWERALSVIDDGDCLESVCATLQDDGWNANSDKTLSADTIRAFAAPLSAPIH
jgi:hypothetical protein